jgi:hypothetical protein
LLHRFNDLVSPENRISGKIFACVVCFFFHFLHEGSIVYL